MQLQKEIPFSENLFIPQRRFLGALIVVPGKRSGDFPSKTGGQGDQSLMVFPKQIQVHPRLIIKAFHPCFGHQGDQIVVTGFRFAEQHQVAAFPVQFMDFIKPGTPGHIDFAADDGFDSPAFCRFIEIDHAVHTAVVGDGHRILTHVFSGVQ